MRKNSEKDESGQLEQVFDGELSISRRALISGTAALAAGFSASQAVAAGDGGHAGHEGHAGHHHSGGNRTSLIRAAGECMIEGEICEAHCQAMLATGDATLASCSAAVRDMMAGCSALTQLAASDSKNLPAMAAVCATILEDCKAECKKHPEHQECMACASACDKCIAECKKITG
jgi:Cys-rich four helix bundle protein (predicted Tat secretion target)